MCLDNGMRNAIGGEDQEWKFNETLGIAHAIKSLATRVPVLNKHTLHVL